MPNKILHNILYIENCDTDRALLSTMLPEDQYCITVAKDGEEAIAKLQEHEFDLIVMGLEMPTMDGFETTRKIRQNLKLSVNKLPIIALSMDNSMSNKSTALEVGINEFITKPYDQAELLMKMEVLLEAEDFDSFQAAKELANTPQQSSPIVNIEQIESFITFIGLPRTKELVEDFHDDYQMRTDKLFDVKTSPDIIGRELHAIASMAGNIGLQRLSVNCRDIMNDIQNIAPESLISQMIELHNLYEISIKELEQTLYAIEHDS